MAYNKEHYQQNKEAYKARVKKYQSKPDVKERNKKAKKLREVKQRQTPERKEYMKEYWKTYREQAKDKINEYRRNKRKLDPLFKLQTNIRSIISKAVKRKGYTKRSKTNDVLGCSFEAFKTHIENQFETWMNWDNYGLYNGLPNFGWDIDHVKPLASAKSEQDVLTLNNYTNLTPLCSYINRDVKKGL